jgi:hypothetical protein
MNRRPGGQGRPSLGYVLLLAVVGWLATVAVASFGGVAAAKLPWERIAAGLAGCP